MRALPMLGSIRQVMVRKPMGRVAECPTTSTVGMQSGGVDPWVSVSVTLAPSLARASNLDSVDRATRSQMMSRIRGKNTKPELAVRKIAHRLGYRFRLHRRDLAGSPDLVFPGRRKVIFVHGCYWHRHAGCEFAYSPKSNVEFWSRKFGANMLRDAFVIQELKTQGWDPLVIWECETKDAAVVASRLASHLGARNED